MGRHNKFGTGGTGKHFKTIVKEERLLTFARLQGELDFEKKKVKQYMNMDLPTLFKSMSGHLGKMIDRATVDDLVCLGTGFLGYQATNDARGAFVGMVGYKLATTDGLASQAAGLTILGSLGLVAVINMDLPAQAESAYKTRLLEGLPEVTDKESAQRYINVINERYWSWRLGFYKWLTASIWDFVDWLGVRDQYSHAIALSQASGGGAR